MARPKVYEPSQRAVNYSRRTYGIFCYQLFNSWDIVYQLFQRMISVWVNKDQFRITTICFNFCRIVNQRTLCRCKVVKLICGLPSLFRLVLLQFICGQRILLFEIRPNILSSSPFNYKNVVRITPFQLVSICGIGWFYYYRFSNFL